MCAIIHTAFSDYNIVIIDIQRIGTATTTNSNVATATTRAILESPRGTELEVSLHDYVHHQAWKQAATYSEIGMVMPVHALFNNIFYPGCTVNHKTAAFVVIGATPAVFGSSVEDCRNLN